MGDMMMDPGGGAAASKNEQSSEGGGAKDAGGPGKKPPQAAVVDSAEKSRRRRIRRDGQLESARRSEYCSDARQGESGDGDEEGEEDADAALGASSLPKVKEPKEITNVGERSMDKAAKNAKKQVRKDISALQEKKAKFKKKLE